MKKVVKQFSKSAIETSHIATDFVCNIVPNKKGATLICLSGDLGAGKTTFTQAAAKALGIKKKISSPTFVIMKRYALKHEHFKNLLHLDAYRLKNANELARLGWQEIISDPKNLICIEWPENIQGALPKKYHKIKISHEKNGRMIVRT